MVMFTWFAGYLAPRRPDSDLNEAQRGRQVRGMGSDDLVDRDGQIPPMHGTHFGNAQAHLPTSPMMGNPMKQSGLHLSSSLGASSINPASVQQLLPQQLGKAQNLQQGQPIRGQMTGTQPVQQNILQQQQNIVQQLRMAVQAGLISPQLLNQQLTPNMLVMLQHLLQAQQLLQQLINQQQQLMQQKQRMNPLQYRQKLDQMNTFIQQVQQQIQQTQQQIRVAQQSLHKQQPQPPQPQQMPSTQQQQQSGQQPAQQLQGQTGANPGDTAAATNKDASSDLPPDMNKLSLKDGGSRLIQWKLPSPEKEPGMDGSAGSTPESRAVGSARPAGQSQQPQDERSHSTASLQSSSTSLPFSDSTWSSTGLSTSSTSWPTATSASAISTTSVASSNQAESREGSELMMSGSTSAPTSSGSPTIDAASDSHSDTATGDPNASLDIIEGIEEFVPGKPWQGSGIKSVEDDPHITPGSVTRSRLSVNTIKEDYLTNLGKMTSGSPVETDASTWSIGPPVTKSSSSQNLLTDVTNEGDQPSAIASELWGVSNVPKPRPPPGLPPTLGSKGSALPQSQANPAASQPGFNRSVSWAPGDRSAFTSEFCIAPLLGQP